MFCDVPCSETYLVLCLSSEDVANFYNKFQGNMKKVTEYVPFCEEEDLCRIKQVRTAHTEERERVCVGERKRETEKEKEREREREREERRGGIREG